jgi:hypothetical protein
MQIGTAVDLLIPYRFLIKNLTEGLVLTFLTRINLHLDLQISELFRCIECIPRRCLLQLLNYADIAQL